jgi:outer membrane lipoprotein carrier protein
MRWVIVVLGALSFSVVDAGVARAGGVDRLDVFMKQTQAARGEFEQRIVNREKKVTQQSSGSLAFQRPGKFRWSYVKPYEQLIVGDGSRVWIYDKELNQVTVRKLDQALGATPAALLAGSNDALNAFVLKDEGAREGLEWVEATPRDKESTFERIRMGFSAQGLERMELTDSFGQTTLLRFVGLQANPRLDANLFTFTPPQGADVIGDK